MPLKGFTKRLKKTFSFRSRGAYDFKDSVDPALRRFRAYEGDRSSGDGDTLRRPSQDNTAPGTSGVDIGSTNSLQQQHPVIKARPNDRGSVGSLNDLPTAQIENLPPIKLVKEINYADESLTLPANYKKSKGEKVKASELKHFKKGVQLADRSAEDVSLKDDLTVEHNLIYQGVGFKHPQAGKSENARIENLSSDITELDDPNYSTIPHFSKSEAKSKATSGRVSEEAVSGARNIRRDFDEAGYSTVPEARAVAVQSLFSTDTDFVDINNFSSIPEATVSLDDDAGYETLDETKKKVDILRQQSEENKTQDNRLVLTHKVRQTESTAVQTDDIYDNNLISPLREASNTVYDNVNQTPLVSPQSCVSGYNSLGNSPSSPPTTGVVTGAGVLSSHDSGIDGAGHAFSPPRLVKITSPQSASQKSKILHTATLVTVTGEPDQRTFVLDEETSQAPKPGIKQENTTSQDTGISSPSSTDNVDDGLYSTIGDRTERPVSSDKNIVDECKPPDMESDDIAPPIPSRNYLLDDTPNTTVTKSKNDSKSVESSLDCEIGALGISPGSDARNSEQLNSGAINNQEKLKVTDETNKNQRDIPQEREKTEVRKSADLPKKVSLSDVPNAPKFPTNTEPKQTGECLRKPSENGDPDKTRKEERTSSEGLHESEPGGIDRRSGHDSVDSNSERPVSGTSGSGSSNPNSPGGNSSDDSQVDLVYNFKELKQSGWYWGPLNAAEAEAKLANKPDGSFLVRDSSDERYILSISFNSQGATHHTRIEHYKGHFSFYSQPTSHGYGTITEFIERVMQHSRNGSFSYFLRPSAPGSPPMQVRLLFPVSRLRVMRSLQHMCRFLIVKHVRIDHIDKLPLPDKIRAYLKEQQYYIEFLED